MKYLILVAMLVSFNSMSKESVFMEALKGGVVYATVGTGYKFDETELIYTSEWGVETIGNNPYSARFELGIDYDLPKNFTLQLGVSHDSQWSTGYPFNKKGEYGKTEVFADLTYRWTK